MSGREPLTVLVWSDVVCPFCYIGKRRLEHALAEWPGRDRVRVVRALTLSTSEREYVLSARAVGARNRRLIFREIMPNVLPTMLSLAVVAIAGAIIAEGGLAYLNLSVARALGRLKLPTLLVWGRRATAPSVESADLWLHRLPEAELEVIEETGLFPHAEAPERFRDVVVRFVEGLPSA